MPRMVEVASQVRPELGPGLGPDTLAVRVRLRETSTVVWPELVYPGPDGRVIEEVRFRLDQYVGEVRRAYAVAVAVAVGVGARGRRRSP
ncbi:hypothetical protein ACF05L_13395 [Streptomyces bobili]|uniref:hypothetical protein n=1 Tax=Streptomyces bobili TaxID=67280 RepID=UPI0036FA3539